MPSADNQVQAAAALGVTRKTLNQWSKLPSAPRPRSNSKIDLDKWQAFIKDNGLKGGETTELENEKLLRMRAQRQAQELRNEVMRKKYLLKSDVIADILKHAGRIKSILCQRIINELPAKAQGMEVPAIRLLAEQAVNSALTDYQEYCDELIRGNSGGTQDGAKPS